MAPAESLAFLCVTRQARCDTATVDAAGLRKEIAGLSADLAVWHAGSAALPNMLQLLAMRRIERTAREGTHPALIAPEHLRLDSRSTDLFRHSAASVVEWSSRYLRDQTSSVTRVGAPKGGRPRRRASRRRKRRVDQRDFEAACDLAYDWRVLETVYLGLASGDLSIRECQGRQIWIQNHRSADVEVLDIVLAGVTVLDEPSKMPNDTATRSWFERHHGLPENIHSLPESIRRAAWTEAHDLLVQQNTTIPEGTDLGGLSLRDARNCYALLIAQLYLNELCTVHLGTQETLVWAIKPHNLVRLLEPYAEGGTTAAAAFVEFCRYAAGRSPLSAPLIPHNDLLLIPTPLVSPIAYERSLLRAAAADPSRSGALGRALGDRARRWAERLRTIPGCRVAERVKVKSQNGTTLGDLDVVVWDPTCALLAVFETKWPVDAASLTESYKVDSLFSAGREQLKRLRYAIERDEAIIRWPPGWEVPLTETAIDWWVASAQQLDSSPEARTNEIRSTSLRLVEHLLPKPDLGTFLRALKTSPMPRQGLEFDLVMQQVAAGPYTLHIDAITIHGAPEPPPERRVSRGWT